MTSRRIYAMLVLSLTAAPLLPPPVAAQEEPVTPIRWWHGAVVAGGLSVLTLLDNPLRSYMQDHRSPDGNRVADVVRAGGEAKLYLGITGGLVATGLLTDHPGFTKAGGRLATTLAMVMLGTQGGKMVAGRARPGSLYDADDFSPFSGRESMPSGHTALAFALATELADDIHRPWASVGLYTLASTVGWSRINDDQHWLSDVAAGAVLGVASAKMVDGRWRLFNIHPPHLAMTPHGVGMGWQASF